MSDTSVKKAFGVYSTIVAAILSLAAGIYFQMINWNLRRDQCASAMTRR